MSKQLSRISFERPKPAPTRPPSAASSGSAPTTPSPTTSETCPVCAGRGWLAYDVPPGDELYNQIVPCRCTLTSRRRELYTGTLAGMTLDSFIPLTADERAALRVARETAQRWTQPGVPRRSLIFYAPFQDARLIFPGHDRPLHVTGCGCGKTHLAVGVAKLALAAGLDARFLTENALLREIKRSYDEGRGGEAALLDDLAAPWLVALDDVGAAQVRSVGWYQDILYTIVNQRYEAGRPLVLTSNLTPDALVERLGPRSWSRLVGTAEILRLDGPDRRELG